MFTTCFIWACASVTVYCGYIVDLECYASVTRTGHNMAKDCVKFTIPFFFFFFFTIPFDQYEFVRVRKYLKHTIPIHILLGEFPKTGSLYLISFIMENFSLLLVSQIYTVSERY